MSTTTELNPGGPPDSPLTAGTEGMEGLLAQGATTRQFVTFQMGEEIFAVPLTDVQEIIRLPTIVEVPMAMSSLEGLANLRGSVLPIINLRRIFHLEDSVHDDATRVVVINRGGLVGFVVDRMARVVTAEPREIETIGGADSTIETDLLEGIIKRAQSMIMILDTEGLAAQLSSATGGRKPRHKARETGPAAVERSTTEIASDELQLVSFELDGQEYALPIESVQEIVQVPGTINAIPKSSTHVLGVMNLRNRLLPLLSLRSMFGMQPAPVGEHNRIVVVAHQMNGVEHAIGLVTDTVKEVLRVQRSLVDPIPPMLAGSGSSEEIDQICRMDGGRRLVSILRPDRLFLDTGLRDDLAETVGNGMENDMDAHATAHGQPADEEEQFVIFRVADEEYGVPIEAVQEIVRIPDQLTRVPKAPSFIEGVVNLRGAVLPVVDQRRRFALPHLERNDRQRIVVFLIQGMRTGFIVDSVSEVLKIGRSAMSAAPDMSMQHGSAISRIANIVELKRMILMLDVEQLLDRSETTALQAAA